jgi:hypothetical protein
MAALEGSTAIIQPYHVERVLTDINADHGNCVVEVLLFFGAPARFVTGGAGARPDTIIGSPT